MLLIIATTLIFGGTALAETLNIDAQTTYEDGTQSAMKISCDETGCCEKYLKAVSNGEWLFIHKLECINNEGEFKTYNDSVDADKPTIVIETPEVIIEQLGIEVENLKIEIEKLEAEKATFGDDSDIVETGGDNSPIATGDDSSIWQNNIAIVIGSGVVGAILGALLTLLGVKRRNKK